MWLAMFLTIKLKMVKNISRLKSSHVLTNGGTSRALNYFPSEVYKQNNGSFLDFSPYNIVLL